MHFFLDSLCCCYDEDYGQERHVCFQLRFRSHNPKRFFFTLYHCEFCVCASVRFCCLPMLFIFSISPNLSFISRSDSLSLLLSVPSRLIRKTIQNKSLATSSLLHYHMIGFCFVQLPCVAFFCSSYFIGSKALIRTSYIQLLQ